MLYKLFSCCIPVGGYRRSLIVDVQRNNYFIIPNGLYEILVKSESYSLEKIKKEYNNEFDEIIEEYFNYLLKNDLIFKCNYNEAKLFPRIDLIWDEPYHITNSIIDIGYESQHNYKKIFDELSDLLCKNLELRFFKTTYLDEILEILPYTYKTSFQSIDILLPYNNKLITNNISDLLEKHSRVTRIIIYNSPNIEELNTNTKNIYFIKTDIKDQTDCGIINSSTLSMNLNFFCESVNFNNCLNRKVCVDKFGEIKNCPSMNKSYGNISNTNLKKVIYKEDFKFFWNIKKDNIEICKNCEYRYICSDCRAYLRNPKNIYSHPAKCNYNPYIAKWKGEAGYVPIEDIGTYNSNNHFCVVTEKLEMANNKS